MFLLVWHQNLMFNFDFFHLLAGCCVIKSMWALLFYGLSILKEIYDILQQWFPA